MNLKNIIFIAINVSIAIVLMIFSYFMPIKLPQGGSLEIMLIPLFIIAYKTNFRFSVLAAIIVTLITFILGILYFISIFQFFLDYLLALSIIGIFSFLKKNIYFGIILTMFLKYIVHVVSGILFYSTYASGNSVIIYSLIYNFSYILPTTIVLLIVIPLILKRLKI